MVKIPGVPDSIGKRKRNTPDWVIDHLFVSLRVGELTLQSASCKPTFILPVLLKSPYCFHVNLLRLLGESVVEHDAKVKMERVTALGITGELARCLATTNVIESPNSVVRRVSGRVTNYKDAEMALRWTAAGFLEAEKSFKKLRGHADLKTLINGLRPAIQQLRKAA